MKIYTKKGDDGDTEVQGKMRIAKSHPRIMAYGSIDEISSALGIVISTLTDQEISKVLSQIQHDLFIAGADLSNPNLNVTDNRISISMIHQLEQWIDIFDSELDPLVNFIFPGGVLPSAQLHHARAITRRAETLVVALTERDEINLNCIVYLNRLSDLLFVLSRLINKRSNYNDIVWKT